MTTSKVLETRLPDLNNEADARTMFAYEGAVRMDIEVARAAAVGRRQQGPYIAKAAWGSRQGLTLDEAEDFANAILEAVSKARADVARRNGV